MRTRSTVIVAGVIATAVLVAFFFAPVVFWYNAVGGPIMVGENPPKHPVYRSLGCVFFGYGDTYAPMLGGLGFGCEGPPVPL